MSQSFPRYKIFYQRILVATVALIAVLLVLTLLNTRQFVERLYLTLANERAETLVTQIRKDQPDAWSALLATRDPKAFFATAPGERLLNLFARVQIDQRTSKFKLYSAERILLYAPEHDSIGLYETDPRLDELFRQGQAVVLEKAEESLNELYVPLFDSSGRQIGALELYEAEQYLNNLLFDSYLPTILIPTLLFIALIIYIGRVMRRAQDDIDQISTKLLSTQARLKEFVSFSTFRAANLSQDICDIPPTRIATTIFYSDIRAFTSLADEAPPTKVVEFLNDLMGLQIDIIQRYDGDVDKLIGDAVLAQFDGTDGEKRALEAAKLIQETIQTRNYPRGVGIGIYSGDVLACAVGSQSRRDFTIIGDTVNLAARLCSAAQRDQVLVEERTLRRSGDDCTQFSASESLAVKGHEHPISIRRWHPWGESVATGRGSGPAVEAR